MIVPMPAFESEAGEALRVAARVLAVGDDGPPRAGARAPASARDVADVLDGLVVGLGHLGRGAPPGRHVAPTPRGGRCPAPGRWGLPEKKPEG